MIWRARVPFAAKPTNTMLERSRQGAQPCATDSEPLPLAEGCVQEHQPAQLAGSVCGIVLSTQEPSFYEHRHAASMVQVSMSQQRTVDGGGIETEEFGVLFIEFAAALVQATVNQDTRPAFDEMT